MRLGPDRRNDDQPDAMTHQQRRKRSAAVVAMHGDIWNAPHATKQILVAASEDVDLSAAREIRQHVRALVALRAARIRDRPASRMYADVVHGRNARLDDLARELR